MFSCTNQLLILHVIAICKHSDKDQSVFIYQSIFGGQISVFCFVFQHAMTIYILKPPEDWLLKLFVLNIHLSMLIQHTFSKKNGLNILLFSVVGIEVHNPLHEHLSAQLCIHKFSSLKEML